MVVHTNQFTAAWEGAFFRFDPAIGQLTAVKLDVDVHATRWFDYVPPADGSTSETIQWQLVSPTNLDVHNSNFVRQENFKFDLLGEGSATLAPYTLGVAVVDAQFSFAMNPALYQTDLTNNPFPNYDYGINDDGGLAGGDLIFTTRDGVQARQLSCFYTFGQCGNRILYTLTFSFVPHGEPVPEPGTWAMMLIGFGAIGASLRRKSRNNASPELA
ncbi:PEP-CTERM sorting domain-containing protein [Sphingomonas rhizophila]|uniref:PEP-CTERM sorting domain-containing protein n=2 Tax=Sphingomonas rhizophila TaxID=2071607 RepID=A0A7G9SE43_9SPHN|nr:PEP-CTERM sorting domain-containing protein [Sphingomonas rhizophila]